MPQMDKPCIEDQTFNGNDFTDQASKKAEYENCTIINCNLSHADLSEVRFIECFFRTCDLSLANLYSRTLNS